MRGNGADGESIEVTNCPPARRFGALRRALMERLPEAARVIAQEHVRDQLRLCRDDDAGAVESAEIACIPPVSGGMNRFDGAMIELTENDHRCY